MLICGQFIAKDLNLWSTLLFVRLLRPLKKTQLLDSWPLSMPLKTRPWINLFKNIVLYLIFTYKRWTKYPTHTFIHDYTIIRATRVKKFLIKQYWVQKIPYIFWITFWKSDHSGLRLLQCLSQTDSKLFCPSFSAFVLNWTSGSVS